MIRKRLNYFVILSLIFSLFSCSDYQKVLKGNDISLKYKKANEYFVDNEYLKALPLFESLIPITKGTNQAEEVYFNYAYCEFKTGELFAAASHFKSFTKSFPESSKAEQSMFISAFCHYLNSPVPTLEQSSTYKAIEELQLFADMFPASKLIDSCNTLVDELRLKLETKAFLNAKQYYDTEYYSSAIIALKNVLKDFPDTKYKDEILFLITKSAYQFAEYSIVDKKKERFQAALLEYANFTKGAKKDSKYQKDILNLKEKIDKELEKLPTQKS